MKYIYELHKTMLERNLILVYEGEFTQEITKSVLAMAERNMDSMGEESSIKRKVFNVMVECLQNIVKHSEDLHAKKENKPTAIFMIGKQEASYIITSGNPIKNEEVPKLRGKLEQINGLDKDGLKQLYKDIIKNTNLSEKGGAGLGFVDMARKSGQKLEFDFQEIDSNYSFFSLKTTIVKE
ncbi:SiaB family protein kinase [Nafulsella turpanensis]|uniref:SiaB family protein kinase n=1 Tax=Nafulsella turpanensis TaxID=1265690 RepID=UPI00034647A2|nr:SiaB family protein kinase [Nafulsella turpanensis]